MPEKIAVIGGGIAGLSGAIRLARSGLKVTLYDKNVQLGGKMNRIKMNGYTFDSGPTLITMPFVIEELFDYAGYTLANQLDLVRLEPICKYFFPDRKTFETSADSKIMQHNLVNSFPDQKAKFIQFIKYAEKIYHQTSDVFLFSPIHEIKKMMKWKYIVKLLRLYQMDPFRSVHQSVSRFFSNQNLIRLFDRYSTYVGSDPYRAPATLNIIPYVELYLGGYYLKGGLYRLVESLVRLAQDSQVEIFTEKMVEKILHDGNEIKGIIVDGEKLAYNTILCNSDVVFSYNVLIDDCIKIKNKLNQLEPSLSGMIFYWGIRGNYPGLKQHNIIFSNDYQYEFRQMFHDQKAADDPTIYIAISAKKDPAHAPKHCENWFVMVNMPYITGEQDWQHEVARIRHIILKKLKTIDLDVENKIECEMVYTPLDLQEKFTSNRGSIYGISSNTRYAAFHRPPNRSRMLKGLYFSGGSTHPGGGIPLCLLSAKIATGLILDVKKK
jgi:phytoene desaturase